jgi:hypothetical protein
MEIIGVVSMQYIHKDSSMQCMKIINMIIESFWLYCQTNCTNDFHTLQFPNLQAWQKYENFALWYWFVKYTLVLEVSRTPVSNELLILNMS